MVRKRSDTPTSIRRLLAYIGSLIVTNMAIVYGNSVWP